MKGNRLLLKWRSIRGKDLLASLMIFLVTLAVSVAWNDGSITAVIRNIFDDVYVKRDKRAEPIDCAELLEHTKAKRGAYTHDFESEVGYTFTQCRAEIEAEHAQRCQDYLTESYTRRSTNYRRQAGTGWTGLVYATMDRDRAQCGREEALLIADLNDSFEVHGDALTIGGLTFSRYNVLLRGVKTRTGGALRTEYYVVEILSGETYTNLRFGDRNDAKAVWQQLRSFIEGGSPQMDSELGK